MTRHEGTTSEPGREVTMLGPVGSVHEAPRPGAHTRSAADPARAWTRVIVLANRAPFRHERDAAGGLTVKRSASGLVTALEPLVVACCGTWVAHAAGTGDMVAGDGHARVRVPDRAPRYRVRYVPLAEQEHEGYYYGFANEGLWPLCHAVHVKPIFRPADFEMYRAVNGRFAAAVASEDTGSRPLVLVQDYHFALAPRMIRERMRSSTVVAFWHIPWPHPRVFRTCPWAARLVDGLLGSDLLGFQTADDCTHFLAGVQAILGPEAVVDGHGVHYRGRWTGVGAYPVGIEWETPVVRTLPPPYVCRVRLCRELGLPDHVRIGVGVDRLDYTKGLHEKCLAVERLLDLRPDLHGRFVFLQVAEPSRDCVPAYREARAQVLATCERINARLGRDGWTPIRLLEAHYDASDVYAFYRAADLCYVGSLDDGMNLVAKEFVCARSDERGVLVLSEFAGAARQLDAALRVNPFDTDQAAAALAHALSMPAGEQARRLRALRANVATYDSRWWAHELLRDAASVACDRPLSARGALFGNMASA